MKATEITFKSYIAKLGYQYLHTYSNDSGMYARITGFASIREEKGVTQVLEGGTLLRLSWKDVDNPLIVGEGTKVIYQTFEDQFKTL